MLTGTEVKSLREGKASLVDGFAVFYRDELWLEQVYIPEYLNGSWTNHAARRRRKLLLHRREIDVLVGRVQRDGYTIVPTALYWKGNKVKAEVALAKGKQKHDKRDTERERDWNREKQRVLRRHNKDA